MKHILALGIALTPAYLWAQDTSTSKVHNMAVKSLSIQTAGGPRADAGTTLTLQQARDLAPTSNLLAKDFEDYDYENGWFNSRSQINLLLGIRFGNKARTDYNWNPLLRVGVTYFNPQTIFGIKSKTRTYRVDTFISQQTNEQNFVDSTSSKSIAYFYTYDQLRLDISTIWYLNTGRRWQYYGGIGVNVGRTLNAQLLVRNTVSSTFSGFRDHGQSEYQSSSESFAQKGGWSGSVYAPLGVDFRIGKKQYFFSKLHLFGEIKPSLDIVYLKEVQALKSFYFAPSLGFSIVF